MIEPQVSRDHYDFERYIPKSRWVSYWHQLDEVMRLNPTNILEIGVGAGIFKKMVSSFGISIQTADIDPNLSPDYVASALDLPFDDTSFDVVACFQLLEHLPYEKSLIAVNEIARVASRYVVISLPDTKPVWRYVLHIPKLGEKEFLIPRPYLKSPEHIFDGQHYWEINKRGYPLSRVVTDFERLSLRLIKTYRVSENSYHRFFVFKKEGGRTK